MKKPQLGFTLRAAAAVTVLALFSHSAFAQTWIPIGPSPTTGGQVEGMSGQGSPVAGAIKSVAVSPLSSDTVYVGTVNGGVWKTTNASSATPTWTPQTDFQASLSIGAVRFDPTDATANTLVAGIGRFSSDAFLGGAFTGLLRTTDGGLNWSPLTNLAGKEISGVAPRGSTIVTAIDFANSFTYGNIGIWRSTNGGASFSQVSGNSPSLAPNGLFGGRAFDLASDPTNNNVLYTGIRDATTNNGVYRSTDAGATWTRVGASVMLPATYFSDSSLVNVKIAVGNSGQVYVGVQNNGALTGLFRSPDGVNNWVKLDTPTTNQNGFNVGINPEAELGAFDLLPNIGNSDDSGGQGQIHFSITADPTDSNIVYVGGDRQVSQLNGSGQETGAFPNSIGANNYSGRLFRVNASLASGSQATPITNNFTSNGSSPHADSRGLTFSGSNLVETSDGGIYKRTSPASNAGAWTSMNGNLQITEIHSIAYDHLSHKAFAGTQDTGTPEQSAVNSTTWSTVSQGDGGQVAADNHSPFSSVRYTSYYYLQGFERRSFNSLGNLTGTTFPALNVVGVGLPINHTNSSGAFDVDANIQFYNPIGMNTVNGDLLVGGRYVYESTDGGSNLNRLGDMGASNHVTALAGGGGAPTANASVLYAVGTGRTFAHRTSGSPTTSVTLLSSYSTVAASDAVALAISSKDWNDLFVANPTQVFRSTDAGSSFSDVTGNLGSMETNVHALAEVTATNLEFILAGGDNGVFLSGGLNFGIWTELGALSLPNAPVFSLVYDSADDVLVAGTLGRGAWEIANFSTLVPEPSSFILAGVGIGLGLVSYRRRLSLARAA
jgi:hypothetical protein